MQGGGGRRDFCQVPCAGLFLRCVFEVVGNVSREIKMGDLNVGMCCVLCFNFRSIRSAMRSVAELTWARTYDSSSYTV